MKRTRVNKKLFINLRAKSAVIAFYILIVNSLSPADLKKKPVNTYPATRARFDISYANYIDFSYLTIHNYK